MDGPRSKCTCGHTGDGPCSEHATRIENGTVLDTGHGSCMVEGCDCQQFTWAEFLPEWVDRGSRRLASG